MLALFAQCTPDRLELINATKLTTIPPTTDSIPLTLNEFVASGSLQLNEFGTGEDWVEVYNKNAQPYVIAADTWYMTDDSTVIDKYKLPAMTIPGQGYLVVWCDLLNTINGSNIHTNFKLSSTGEFIGIAKKQGSTINWIEKHPFGLQPAAMSEGKLPNGTGNWQTLSPTFGAVNN